MEWLAATVQISIVMNLHLCNIVLKTLGMCFDAYLSEKILLKVSTVSNHPMHIVGILTVSLGSVKVFLKVNRCQCHPVLLCTQVCPVIDDIISCQTQLHFLLGSQHDRRLVNW